MSFPTNPVDGQRHLSDAGIVYIYDSADGVWRRERFTSGYVNLWGNRNAIINGDMRIAQRNTTFTNPSSGAYLLDRFRWWNSSSAQVTITQDSDVPDDSFLYSMKMNVTTADTTIAAGDIVSVDQKIEGFNFRKFKGQTATLSFWVKTSKSGAPHTMCVSFRNVGPAGPDRSYVKEVVIGAANTWEKKSVTLDFDYTGGTWNYTTGIGLYLNFSLAIGSGYQGTADSWQSNNTFATSNQSNFVGGTDAVWVTGVQLELGPVATDFEFLDFGDELAQCQRYYSKSYDYATVPGSTVSNGSRSTRSVGQYFHLPIDFPVAMRSNAVTGTIYSPNTGASGNVYDSGTGDKTATFFVLGESGGSIYNVALVTNNGYIQAHWTADAEL